MLSPGQRGIKRKLDDGEDDEESITTSSSSQDRESIFAISLCKLNRYRQIPDPSLRRSVLICNTLRHIEREMESRGLHCASVTATAGFLPALQADSNITLDPLPTQVHVNGLLSPQASTSIPVGCSQSAAQLQLPVENEQLMSSTSSSSSSSSSSSNQLQPIDLRTPTPSFSTYEKNLSELDSFGRSTTPFPSSLESGPCRTDSCGALWNESDERNASSISWSTVLNLSSQNETDFISVHANTQSSSTSLISCDSCSSTSSGSSGGSEIFGDIDLSLYDFDLLPLSPPNMRLTPLSAEELLRSFPSNEAGVSSNGCFKNEFLSEELDHIMHILVGM